jgi:hypothetical protein
MTEAQEYVYSDDEVAWRAYALWEGRNRPFGSPETDWYLALRQLRNENQRDQAWELLSAYDLEPDEYSLTI